jgi:hypothetical protein
MKVQIHNQRVYHVDDHAHTGPSVSFKEYLQRHNPPPRPASARPAVWQQELLAMAQDYYPRWAAKQARQAAAPSGVPVLTDTLGQAVQWKKAHGLI